MKINLDSKRFTVTVRGAIGDGPVIPEALGLPWPGQVVSFEATLIHEGTGWQLRGFVCDVQEVDKHGNTDPDDSYRYRKHYEGLDCPAWAERLTQRLIPLGMLPVVLPTEFYLP